MHPNNVSGLLLCRSAPSEELSFAAACRQGPRAGASWSLLHRGGKAAGQAVPAAAGGAPEVAAATGAAGVLAGAVAAARAGQAAARAILLAALSLGAMLQGICRHQEAWSELYAQEMAAQLGTADFCMLVSNLLQAPMQHQTQPRSPL